MKHSDALGAIGTALAAANMELRAITKDHTNTFFKNKYVTLDAIIETVRPVLASHGLSVIQGASTPHTDAEGGLTALAVETMLLHKSGEWIQVAIVLPVGTDKEGNATAQTAGSTTTYGRRYGLSALLCLSSDEDDDGNKASERHTPAKRETVARPAVAPRSGASERVVGAIDRLPSWPKYEYAGVPIREAPTEALTKMMDWQPKPEKVEAYAPLKDAIALELERRRNDMGEPHPGLEEPEDELPF